jgi:hypothetical protein
MKNLHLIPTDKPSRLGYLTKKGKEVFKDLWLFNKPMPNILDSENQHIYITNSEDIKEGDWFIDDKYKQPMKYFGEGSLLKSSKKIILTTDPSLAPDAQKIDDEFLEWFVKNPSCEEVEVQKWFDGLDFLEYKIIIPQEEPKQETLEEAAGKLYPLTGEVGIDHRNYLRKEGFINGAKYQAERMYSEKEVLQLLLRLQQTESYDNLYEWFEQFKKKYYETNSSRMVG